MDKSRVRQVLIESVRDTCRRYSIFQGVIPFGSFVTTKENPRDLDIIPVVSRYGSSWDFTPESEADYEDDHPDYLEYMAAEEFFLENFRHLVPNWCNVLKTRSNTSGLVHIESLVSLDSPELLTMEVMRLNANYLDFIGEEFTKNRLKEIFE